MSSYSPYPTAYPGERRHRRRPTDTGRPQRSSTQKMWLVAAFCFSLLLLLLAETTVFVPWRAHLTYGGALLLLFTAFLGVEAVDGWRAELRHFTNLCQILLLGWTMLGATLSPFHAFANLEVARIVSGVAAFFFCAYVLDTPRLAVITASVLTLAVLAFALFDFSQMATTLGRLNDVWNGSFGTHETTGTLLLLVMPLCGAVALHTRIANIWRFSALGVFIILLVAFFIAQCRSSWIGAVGGFICWVIFRLQCADTSQQKKQGIQGTLRLISYSVLAIVGVMTIALAVTGHLGGIADRIMTLGHLGHIDTADGARVAKWNAAALMAQEKPILGYGPGSYVILQAHWAHQGNDIVEVLNGTVQHTNIGHNYYAQWGADNGLVGLLAHLMLVLACGSVLARAVPRMNNDPLRQAVALGALTTLAAGGVEAFSSPSYNFPGLYTLYWSIIGIGFGAFYSMAIPNRGSSRSSSRSSGVLPRKELYLPLLGIGFSVVLALLGTGAFWAWGDHLKEEGNRQPVGQLSVAKQKGPVGGERWVAAFKDGDGKLMATAPGTIWSVTTEGRPVGALSQETVKQGDTVLAAIALDTGSPAKDLRIKASFRDRWGRFYEAEYGGQ